MSGITLDQEINNEVISPEQLPIETPAEQPTQFKLPDWVMAQTGEGSVDDYMDHTLNFNQSKGMARIIRGLTGIFQNGLNFAVVDIVIGMLELSKDRKRGQTVAAAN